MAGLINILLYSFFLKKIGDIWFKKIWKLKEVSVHYSFYLVIFKSFVLIFAVNEKGHSVQKNVKGVQCLIWSYTLTITYSIIQKCGFLINLLYSRVDVRVLWDNVAILMQFESYFHFKFIFSLTNQPRSKNIANIKNPNICVP